MKMRRFYSCIILIIFSRLLCYCSGKDGKNGFSYCGSEKREILQMGEFRADSIEMLLPTLACPECLITSKRIFNSFNKKNDIKFIIQSGSSVRDSKIIYSKELTINTGLTIDSIGSYSKITGGDTQNIWMILYNDNCVHSLRIEGGMEEDLIQFLEKLD